MSKHYVIAKKAQKDNGIFYINVDDEKYDTLAAAIKAATEASARNYQSYYVYEAVKSVKADTPPAKVTDVI